MVLLGAVVLLCSQTFEPFRCSAMEVWSDDFNDGDYDGWTVIAGNFSVSDNALQAEGDALSCIIHPSPVTTGTWSFDVYIAYPSSNPGIWFMMDMEVPYLSMESVVKSRVEELSPNVDETEMLQAVFGGSTGYGFRFWKTSIGFNLDLGNGEQILPCGWSPSRVDGSIEDGWHHMDVTRNSDGRICIYVDEMLYADEVETGGGTTSYCFVLWIQTAGVGRKLIDNIVVSDTIDIEPPSPETPFYMQTWFLATVGAAVIAVVIGAVWMLSRKAR